MRRSLLRPRRCPAGTWPSSGNVPATLVSVGVAIAPDNLHLHGDVAVLRNVGAKDCTRSCAPHDELHMSPACWPHSLTCTECGREGGEVCQSSCGAHGVAECRRRTDRPFLSVSATFVSTQNGSRQLCSPLSDSVCWFHSKFLFAKTNDYVSKKCRTPKPYTAMSKMALRMCPRAAGGLVDEEVGGFPDCR